MAKRKKSKKVPELLELPDEIKEFLRNVYETVKEKIGFEELAKIEGCERNEISVRITYTLKDKEYHLDITTERCLSDEAKEFYNKFNKFYSEVKK